MTIGRKIVGAILLLMGLNLAVTNVSAQVVYSCDFEDATENAKWTLNKISNQASLSDWKNIWRIGQPGNCASGNAGLYICPNDGSGDTMNVAVPITSTTLNDFIVAYRDSIQGLTPNTDYRISFDWRGNGKVTDFLYVYWIPSSYTKNTNSATGVAGAPSGSTSIATYLLPNMPIRGGITWQSYSAVFKPSTSSGKLLFLWLQGHGPAINPPAAVDNIEIADNSTICEAPDNLQYRSSGMLSWTGSASAYDVRSLNPNTNVWFSADNVQGNSCMITGVTEGFYTFQVRARCADGSHSPWSYLTQFAYTKGVRCIDFMDLDSAATCWIGSAESTDYNAKKTRKKEDHGYESIDSRHTIHYIPGETDPRTDGMLPTIPPGEVASVRLGNWKTGAEAEAIEYKLKVQAGTSDILKLKYAVVLEDGGHTPGGPESGPHGSNEQSHFYVSIKDAQGNPIEVGCLTFDFSADPDAASRDATWHVSSQSAAWKEWTEVSIGLVKYVGQVITIYLATYDCTAHGHYGYAYFAMNCENGQLEGSTCGDYRADHFIAPDGFNYRWYKQSDPSETTLSTSREFRIDPLDANIYVVDVINRVNGCSFPLVANPNPRFPMTEVRATPSTKDCQNVVRFSNSSHVVYRSKIDSTIMKKADEEIESMTWDFGDGTTSNSKNAIVEHTFPQEGGTYNVVVTSSISGGVCTDPDTIKLVLPKLGDQRIETVEQYCYKGNNPYIYKGQPYTDSFADSATVTLPTGCDSTGILTVNFVSTVEQPLFDTICGERTNYTYNGTVYPDSGTYRVLFEGASALGCDSTVILHLYKHPIPKIQVDSAFVSCADEMVGLTLPYQLTGDLDATVDSIHVRMGDEAVANGFLPSYDFAVNESLDISWPDTIKPNVYQGVVEFSSPWCTTYTYPFKIELDYPSSVLDQKNGLVAVLNSATNGGYEFLSYQWYRNDERMDGETASYVRVSDEDDMGAEFYVVVLRNGDNVVLRSCPIKYVGGRTALDNISDSSRAVKVMENGIIYIIRDGVRYTVLGTIVSRHEQE